LVSARRYPAFRRSDGLLSSGSSHLEHHAVTSNIMLPLGGFALALFAGWKLPARLLAEELGVGLRTARILQSLLRYIVPTCVAILALFPLWT
jgi:SNF family Na+-dependent transporter